MEYNSEIEVGLVKCEMMMSDNKSFYHTINHVYDMIDELERRMNEFNLSETEFETVYLAILYHDIVYVPGSTTNEEDSAKIAPDSVKDLILSTKIDFRHRFTNKLERVLHTLDWSGFSNFNKMFSNHVKIFNEALNQEFLPITITNNQISFYKQLLNEMECNNYKIDFFNESNNKRAIENLKRICSEKF